MRRQFDLPPEDEQFLDEYSLPWETIQLNEANGLIKIGSFSEHKADFRLEGETCGVRQ